MAEEMQKKKKAGIIRRILKWIGLAILSVLLILAIVFQAPWKVITLFFIVLAACAILPKHLRKWFWLSAGAIVVILIIWVFMPDDNEGWRPYTFEKELAALEAQYAVPDEENAALIYDELFKTMDRDPNEPEFFLRSRPSSTDEPWLSKDHPEMAEWLKGYQSTIEKLLQAAKKDRFRFPIGADPVTYGEHMKKFSKMRRCTFLLVSAANNDVAEGRFDQAIEKYLIVLQMAKHLYQQPVMIDFLVGFAIEGLSLIQLNRFVIEGQPNREQLELIGNSIKGLENNWSSDWRKILDFEKLYAKNMLCSLAYEVNPKGKTRLSRGRFAITGQQFPQNIPPKTFCKKKLYKAKTIFSWFFMPSTPKTVAEIIDASFNKYYAMAEPDFDWDKEPSESQPRRKANYRYLINILTTCPGSGYYRIHEIYLRDLAYRRGSRLLVAIKRYHIEHGAWPANLDTIKSTVPAEALIDPVTGSKLTYENHGERFSLYGEAANIWPK